MTAPDPVEVATRVLEELLRNLENGNVEVQYFNVSQGIVDTTPPEAQAVAWAYTGERHYCIGVRSVVRPKFEARP